MRGGPLQATNDRLKTFNIHVLRLLAGAGRLYLVEKVLAFIGHAEKCQALAEAAPTGSQRARLLKLAQMWLEFAKTRRRVLIIEGNIGPNRLTVGLPNES
jgi:hypothetical protein